MVRIILAAAIGCALATTNAAAQSTAGSELARIDSLIARGRFSDARTSLERWSSNSTAQPAEGDVAAHAALLRARLTASADSALPLYLDLALNHPASRFAPHALLRLGQGYLARGEHERARGYLERLLRDYPTFTDRPTGMLWLARAQRAQRRLTDACTTLGRALDAAQKNTDLRTVIEHERARCTR